MLRTLTWGVLSRPAVWMDASNSAVAGGTPVRAAVAARVSAPRSAATACSFSLASKIALYTKPEAYIVPLQSTSERRQPLACAQQRFGR